MGDRIAVRVGGCFHYEPGDEARPLLLVAGGIGINPLLSILKHCCELRGSSTSSGSSGGGKGSSGGIGEPQLPPASPAAAALAAARGTCSSRAGRCLPPRAVVLFSASSPAELAFRRELSQLQAWAGGSIRLQVHVTGPEWRGREAEWGGRWGRIRRHDLAAALHWLQARTTRSEDVSGDDGGASLDAAAAAVAAAESAATGAASWPGGFNSGSCSSCGGVGEDAGVGSCEVAALLCGPSGMEDAMLADLLSLGLRPGQIRHERWW